MGYYTGSGVVTSGTSAPSLRAAGFQFGEFVSYQRVESRVTTKNGVSLSECQSERGDLNLTNYTWPGGLIEFACKGTRKSVSFSQIGGSNLYSLNIVNDTIQFRGIHNSGDTGWLS